MKTDIWFPTFIGEYMQETIHLNRAEHGSYQLLRIAYWSNCGALPDDDESLRTICKCTPEEWPRTKALLSKLFIVGSGVWVHERLDEELAKAGALLELRRKRGANGAARRWQKHASSNASSNGHGVQGPNGANGKPMVEGMAEAMVEGMAQVSEGPKNGKSMVEGMVGAMVEGMAEACRTPSPLPVQIENKEIERALPEIPPMTRKAYEAMAEMRGIPKACYDWFWNTCEGTGWLDFRGRPIRKVEPLLLNLFVKWRQGDFKRRGGVQEREHPMTDAELLRHAQG